MNARRGGSKLQFEVEKPDEVRRGKMLLSLKDDLILVIDISKYVHYLKKNL